MTPDAHVTPTSIHSLPTSLKDESGDSLQENVRIAANTASLMLEMGMPISAFEMTDEDNAAAHELFSRFDTKKTGANTNQKVNPPQLYQGNVAVKLSALLNEYDHHILMDAAQARTYITNRLLEISSCGEAKHELKAIELLGKLSDVGAFTDKSEITVTHRTSNDLKAVIEEKLHRLMTGTIIDVVPDAESASIEEELGLLEAGGEVEDAFEIADEPPRDTDDTEPAPEPV